MKDRISRLSRGIEQYNIPVIEISVTTLEHKVGAGGKVTGSFDVYTDSDYELRGLVYTNQDYIKLIDKQFIGTHCQISYEIDATSYYEGELLEGKIHLVSNCGESFVPVEIQVVGKKISTSLGKIGNLFQFVDLVKQAYEEAIKLFYSTEFPTVFLKDDLAAICMYEGCIKSYDKKRALEEFIIGIHKKQTVLFQLSEEQKEYENITENYKDSILLTASTWGYQQVQVEVDCDFITDYKESFTTEDCSGKQFEFQYLIRHEQLHAGNNYGCIRFKTIQETLECRIQVTMEKRPDDTKLEVKRCISELIKKYLEFRLKNNGVERWADASLQLIERARSFDDSNLFLKLFQAQVCISRKRDAEAEWLLAEVSEPVLAKREEDIELYCYYLYIRTLQRRELDFTIQSLNTIRKYYESGHDSWKLLWLLLYMDNNFENNKSLKLTRIKEQYKLGCSSPLMYYEALYVLNRNPGLLRVLNKFELQVLSFGSKHQAIQLRLAVQIAELALLEKEFRPILFRILTEQYKKFENKVILSAILSILIRGDKREEQYFPWYSLGVEMDLNITGLFEYYIFSMPADFNGTMPNTVLMYYVYNGKQLYEKEAFVYQYVLRNKDRFSSIYKKYQPVIEQFTLEQFRIGAIDENIAVLYKEVLSPAHITSDNCTSLVSVLHQWKLICENPGIQKVIVIHKELESEVSYILNRGVAYVHIYTEDAIILFEDCYGTRYLHSVNYTLERMVDNRELLALSAKMNETNRYVMADLCEQSLKYQKNIPEAMGIFTQIIEDSQFRLTYTRSIINDVIEYYVKFAESESLEVFLMQLDTVALERNHRNRVTELMIEHGIYEKAGQQLHTYGICGLDAKQVLKYCNYALEQTDALDNQLLQYCAYAFYHGKYNGTILEYLEHYFNGTTREMLELWRVSRGYLETTRNLEERLIAQMIFTRTHLGSLTTVFEAYVRHAAAPMLKKGYYFFLSYEYFVKENPIEDMFFQHLENAFEKGEMEHAVCQCAYLKYLSDKKRLSATQLTACERMIWQLEQKGVFFNFFKKFKGRISLPAGILDKTVIEYRTGTKGTVSIHYELEQHMEIDGMHGEFYQEHKGYQTENMQQVFQGLYVKSFLLFYGEMIRYYIVEEDGADSVYTESNHHFLEDVHVETGDSKYGMLNDTLQCMAMHDEKMVQELVKQYSKTKFIVNYLM